MNKGEQTKILEQGSLQGSRCWRETGNYTKKDVERTTRGKLNSNRANMQCMKTAKINQKDLQYILEGADLVHNLRIGAVQHDVSGNF